MGDQVKERFGPFGVAVVAVLGMLFVSVPGGSPSTPSAPKLEAPKPTDESPADDPDPLDVLREYVEPGSTAKKPDGEKGWSVQSNWKLDLPSGQAGLKVDASQRKSDLGPKPLPHRTAEFLIAVVPDPIDSPFAGRFDGLVQAIQWAYESRGFILHSSFLPWPLSGQATKTNVHRRVPGVLLFRQAHRNPEPGSVRTAPNGSVSAGLAVVWLVGENPISGLHKAALTRALDLTATCGWERFDTSPKTVSNPAQLSLAGPHCATLLRTKIANTPLPVLGPWSSASKNILPSTLVRWVHPQRIHSDRLVGSNSRSEIERERVRRKTTKDLKEFIGGSEPFRIISGSASGITARDLADLAAGKVKYSTTTVPNSILVRHILKSLKASARNENVAILYESNTSFGNSSTGHFFAKDRWTPEFQEAMLVPFPTSLSRLKLDLEAAAKLHQPPQVSLRPEFAFPKLQGVDREHRDGMPYFSRSESAVMLAQYLRDSLRAIHQRRIRFVGIVATDDHDVLYLNKLVSQQCPLVQTFTTEPSVLLLHPEEASHMHGTIVGSTYPLFPENREWSHVGKDPRRLAFSGSDAHGYYNAALALCHRDDLMLEYGRSNSCNPQATPDVWISVVGHNGTLVPLVQSKLDAPSTREENSRNDLDLLYPRDSNKDEGKSNNSRASHSASFAFSALAFACCVILLLVLLVLLIPKYHPYRHLGRRWYEYGGLAGLTAMVGVAIPVLSVLAVAVVECFSHSLWVVRAIDLASGVSPLLPIVLLFGSAAVLGGVWFHQANPDPSTLRLFEEVSRSPKIAELTKQSIALDEAFRSSPWLRDFVKTPSVCKRWPREFLETTSRWQLLCGCLIAPTTLFGVWYTLDSYYPIETAASTWSGLLIVGLWMAGLLVAFSLVRFLYLWHLFRNFTQEIDRLPMGCAFDALPDVVRGFAHGSRVRDANLEMVVRLSREAMRKIDGKTESPADFATEKLSDLADSREWEYRSVAEAFGHKKSDAKESEAKESGNSSRSPKTREAFPPSENEQFLAGMFVLYIGQYVSQLYLLAGGLVTGTVLLLFGVSSYPFRPERPLISAALLLAATVVAGFVYVICTANTNALLSRLNGTAPGRLTPDRQFLTSIGVYVLPLVAVAVVQQAGWLRMFLDPILGVCR